MHKKFISLSVSLDRVSFDRIFLRIWQHASNPDFFKTAVRRFKYYTHPVAYELRGRYYLLSNKESVDILIEQGQEEILIDIIEINEAEVIIFLLSYQFHQHKQPRCMAELFKVASEYASTPEGKKWLKEATGSEDKEVQYSVLFGISLHATKCYLKIVQKGNEKYLNQLAEMKEYSLSKAYADCLAAEKESKESEAEPSTSNEDKIVGNKRSGIAQIRVASGTEDALSEKNLSLPCQGDETMSGGADADFAEVTRFLEKYRKKDEPQQDSSEPKVGFARKVIVLLCDDSELEITGKLEMRIEESVMINTDRLRKQADNKWALPLNCKSFSLTMLPEDTIAEAA